MIIEIAFGHAKGEDRNEAIFFKGKNAPDIFNVFFPRHALEIGGTHGAAQSELIVLDTFGDVSLDQGIAAVPGLVGHGFVVDAAFQSFDGLAPLRIIEDNWLYFWLMFRQRQAEDGGRAQHEKSYSEYREKRSRHLRWRETIRSHAHHTNVRF